MSPHRREEERKKEAQADRAIQVAEKLLNSVEKENRDFTPEETEEFGRLLTEAGEINRRLRDDRRFDKDQEERISMANQNIGEYMEPQFNRDGSALTHQHANRPNLVTPKLSAFKGPEGARNAYDSSLWLRGFVLGDQEAKQQLESRRPAWMSSQTEGNPTQGGYSVPLEFHRSIIDYRDQVGIARKMCTVLPLGTDQLAVPKLSSGPTVYVVGEENSITASSMAFESVTLAPKKRACLSYVSNELNADNAVGLMDLLAQRMALALALDEDGCFVTGDGGGSYGGILGVLDAVTAATAGVVSCATGNDLWTEITFGDIGKMMASLASKYRTNGQLAFLCSSSFKWQVLDRLSLAQGGAMMEDMVNGVRSDLFASYPVYTSDYMPTTTAAATICLLFGNFKQSCLLGDRQGIRLATSEHLGFVTDQIVVRAVTRYDINNHEMGDTVTAGGVVALKTAS
jgi:HK97 family phage major capsid protein